MAFRMPSYTSRIMQSPGHHIPYLTGVRGLLTISFLLWLFLSIFIPTVVTDVNPNLNVLPTGRTAILRKVLSPLLWNESLIYSSIIFYSARSICIPFLVNPSRATASSAIFCRAVRLFLPTATALALSVATMRGTSSYTRLSTFKETIPNHGLSTPVPVSSPLVFFNSLFNLFWRTRDFAAQSGNAIFPGHSIWCVTTIFMQSHTIYMMMLLLPYTRTVWRTRVLILFVIAAWWVQSWAWYSVTALMLADGVVNMEFAHKARQGLPLRIYLPNYGSHKQRERQLNFPVWLICAVMVTAGLAMKYMWATSHLAHANKELLAHAKPYHIKSFYKELDLSEPHARIDNFLIILGFALIIESYTLIRQCLAIRILLFLGQRSFAYFLIAPIVLYSFGMSFLLHLRLVQGWDIKPAVIVVGSVSLIIVIFLTEVFYWFIDFQSIKFAQWLWKWMRR